MPPHLDYRNRVGAFKKNEISAKTRRKYKELYPNGKDLSPGSEFSMKLIAEVMSRAQESALFMREKFPTWRFLDETQTAYIPLSEMEKRNKERDPRAPVSIVVPESYANLDVFLTYFMAAYGQSPVFPLEPGGPEDTLSTILMEMLVEHQVREGKALLSLNTQWRDGHMYGIGPMAANWETDIGSKITMVPQGIVDPVTGEFTQTGMGREFIDDVVFAGTRLYSIDPYKYLPDRSVPLYEVQKGEYVGFVSSQTYHNMLLQEASPGSIMFNVQYLKEGPGQTSIYLGDESGRATTGFEGDRYTGNSQLIDTIYLYWKIIPSEYELSDSDVPEIWLFGISGDSVITTCQKFDAFYRKFPISVCAPDYGGHEMMPISRMEIMSGGQEAANFFYNSHMANVYSMMQNLFVVDPKIIHMPDVIRPYKERAIRVRRPVWGKGVEGGIEQLKVQDATANHMNDYAMNRDIFRSGVGTPDAMMGVQRIHGERVTGQEFMKTFSNAVSRLQKSVRLVSLQSMVDIGKMFVAHTQQYMEREVSARVLGKWAYVLASEYGITDPSITISPYDLDGTYDVTVNDGSLLVGEDASSWGEMLQQVIPGNPELMQTLDSTRIWLHWARLQKMYNPSDFIRKQPLMPQMNVAPDQQVAEQAKAGNIVPLSSATG